MRVTALDGCGRPRPGACSSIVSDGFVSVAFTAVIDAGNAISVTNAAGAICVSDTPVPRFTNYTVELSFCQVNPELLALVSGQTPLFDAQTGAGNGFTVNSDINAGDSGFALELWSNVPGVQCDPANANSQGNFGYLLVPFLQGGNIGDFSIQNDAVTFVVSGAATKPGSGWGVGPYDVVQDDTGAAGPLANPVKSGDHLLVQLTGIAPPDAACDCQSVGSPATGAAAGSPGTFTPADGYPPFTLADLVANPLTATPTTAWTASQYVVLGDNSRATWDGTTWKAATTAGTTGLSVQTVQPQQGSGDSGASADVS
jgi:hypothetical protein